MIEYSWPAVTVVGMVLLFIRTRPTESSGDASLELQKALRLNQIDDDIAELKKSLGETTPKALVDRLNVLSKEMIDVVRPVLSTHGEKLQELERKVTRFEAAKTAKLITGVEKPG